MPYRYLKFQLHGHSLNLNDDGRILVANIKCMTSHEANYSPHPCFIGGLHQTVGLGASCSVF